LKREEFLCFAAQTWKNWRISNVTAEKVTPPRAPVLLLPDIIERRVEVYGVLGGEPRPTC
jgi:hypothetical protein